MEPQLWTMAATPNAKYKTVSNAWEVQTQQQMSAQRSAAMVTTTDYTLAMTATSTMVTAVLQRARLRQGMPVLGAIETLPIYVGRLQGVLAIFLTKVYSTV